MPPITSTAAFKACYENLAEINKFVTSAAEAAGLDEETIYAVQRAVDEACSNIIEHAYQGKEGGKIESLCIACEYGLITQFRDYGLPFDPNKIPSPNLNMELSERPVGGLGLYFMRQLMDEVSFEFSPNSIGNTITMVKYNDRHLQSDIWPQIITLVGQLMSLPNLSEQCSCVRDTASQLFGAQVNLWLTPNWAKGIATGGNDNYPPEPPTNIMLHSLSEFKTSIDNILVTGTDLARTPENEKLSHSSDRKAIASLLVAFEEIIGVIQLERIQKPFTKAEVKAINGLASQAAMAIYATRQTAIGRWRLEQLSLVRSVSEHIANVVDLIELAQKVTQLIVETFGYYYVAIFTCQVDDDMLKFCASSGPSLPHNADPSQPANLPLQVKKGSGLIGLAVSTGNEVLSNDVRSDPRYQYHDTLPETLAEVAIPLKIGAKVLGVLDIQSDKLEAFTEIDTLVLRSLADNIAIAVEGTLLYSALHHRAEQLASIVEVSNAITSILNLDDLLEEIIHLIRERLGYKYIQIFTVNPVFGVINYMAGSSPNNDSLCATCVCYKLDDPMGLIPLAARTATTITANDVSKESKYLPTGDFPAEIRSEMVIPLVFGNKVEGIIDIQSDLVNAFTEEDRSLIGTLADNIAAAIRNAQLFRSEAWRRQVADSMHAVAGLLSADVSLSHLLDSILTELEKALPCDAAAIWLVESQSSEEENSLPYFQLAAIHNRITQVDKEMIEKILDDVPDSRVWLVEALQSKLPLIRTRDNLPDAIETEITDPFGTVLGLKGNYSAIAARLHTGDTALGVLTLVHQTPGRYGAESQAMTATFASYAAVAIENAKLYETTHDQAWVSTVLLQVAEATQSLTDIDELLSTVVQITPLLVGVNACALMMWDEDTEVFTPGAAQGLNEEQQNDFDQWVVHLGDDPAFDQMRIAKSPILLPHWSFAKSVNESNQTEIDVAGIDERRTRPLVLFPMVVQDTVLGGLLVDFAVTEYRSDTDINEEFLHDEKLAVIQGIAHQTAIAVENIRLLKAQKEEAYVSVALLQVAQAVVSLIDLHEILETIVRIAPILVGVNRCAIYLWDDDREGFCLTQSYGLSHELEDFLSSRLYRQGDFPLLDAVHKSNKLIHMTLNEATEQPLEWEQMIPDEAMSLQDFPDTSDESTQPDINSEFYPGDSGFKEEFLKHSGALLYAFPLSVKGTILGVFLAEEAPSPSDTLSYHVRERRLEILTGITQQASLAIQNDRLQSEVVERERLEREMQLARSIQLTFLPHQLPDVPNWDLDIRWRTARQVGGDFYDIIELPDKKLGLVIADVADKGMPAALFMTLVRTLIRAAVHEEESPSAVLEEVNSLMIPDTQNGMFVTVIYAVIYLESGLMVYANAGHNLPLLVRTSNKDILQLHKGGIALGVNNDIHLADHNIALEPGDCVVFYTDGVTEAFSPVDEMYGEERLHQTIREACMDNANTILDAIDRSVSEFIGEYPRTDDLTLVAIRRVGTE
jgi:sigma-B regulation protein RsbU (phosphoserine phosphatase)